GTTPSLCKSASDGDWWARITSASGDTAYKCVVRRQHPGAAPPATARWRWLEDDETMGIRCPGAGCALQRELPADEAATIAVIWAAYSCAAPRGSDAARPFAGATFAP